MMRTPPRSRLITIIGWVFIAVGVAGSARALWDIAGGGAMGELGIMVLSGIVAILGGALLLRGSTWGRWVLAAWMAFHIAISALHDLVELAVHVVLFGAVLFFLFRAARRPADSDRGSP